MTKREGSLTQLLPVLLLVLAIGLHGASIELHDADPQRGSAFAMFSTVEIGSARRIVTTVPGEPSVSVEVPASLSEASAELVAVPSDEFARALGCLLLEKSWAVEGGEATSGGDANLERTRVQVVGLTVEADTVRREVLSEATVHGSDS